MERTSGVRPLREVASRTGARAALACALSGLALLAAGCGDPAAEAPAARYPSDPAAVRGFDAFEESCAGIPALMRWEHLERGGELSEAERRGACTWYFWPGGDPLAESDSPVDARGNPRFWRQAEIRTARINLLSFVDSRHRGERFARLGAVNDPGCRQAEAPDPYGLWLDACEDPYSSGIMGLRLYPNPAFDAATWSPERYLDPERTLEDAAIEPPYLVGMTCGVCHITFSPTDPPRDPERPEWENLAPALGNQYLREGEMFKAGLSEDDFLYWVYDSQQPGTSDTSRISVDWINNPNAINPIFSILSERPTWTETMNDGRALEVPRVLKDGADSIGPAGAALRVYVNIGTCPDYRTSLEDPFAGRTAQRPFLPREAEESCLDWRLTAARIGPLAAFLDSIEPYPLAAAPEGARYLTASEEELTLGRRVFGGHCARCHSSKLPAGYAHAGPEKHSPEARRDWIELALRDDFLEDNFLSDDQRYPLVSDDPRFAIGTNAARALATNALDGRIWERFSSATYKGLPSPGTLRLYDPYTGASDIEHPIPGGGPGYYRTPSLINVWATAPLLHNNLLGLYNGDPSVAGRMEAFEDAAEKLLWPERRPGEASIKVTPRDSVLRLASLELSVPAGTPINLLAHIDPRPLASEDGLSTRFDLLRTDPDRLGSPRPPEPDDGGPGGREPAFRAALRELLALSRAPDLVEDHGHDSHYGALTDAEKRALIQLMKSF